MARSWYIATLRRRANLRVLIAAAIGVVVVVLTTPSWAQSVGTFTPTGSMAVARSFHTATLLPNGKVLVAGGRVYGPGDYQGRSTETAELYDPISGTFSPAGRMTVARTWHSATLLPDGRVLIVGGDDIVPGGAVTTTAELYDPSTNSFSRTGSPVAGQHAATATLLKNGKVLIAGGVAWTPCCAGPGTVSNPELYDPATGTFSVTGPFAEKASDNYNLVDGPSVSGAARLADGRVLITATPQSEIYDPTIGQFRVIGAMATSHPLCRPGYISGRTLTVLGSGEVLLAGGAHEDCGRYAEVERYDPTSETFAVIGHLTHWRNWHTATVLPDGTVLMAGGEFTDGTVDKFDPHTGTAVAIGTMGAARSGHTATLLRDGRVLLAGGEVFPSVGSFLGSLATAELYSPERLDAPAATGTFISTGNMAVARSQHTATVLRNGKVLIAGCADSTSAELYDPSTRAFTPTGNMTAIRCGHTATLLADGRVLIAGGRNSGGIKSAELYDPATGIFTATADMLAVQIGHTATLLNDGKVLIAGGVTSTCCDPAMMANPELYDPLTGTFSLTGAFAGAGDGFYVTGGPNLPTAVLLRDGRVLIAGEPTAELYDPVTGTFSLTGAMTTPCGLGGHPTYIGGRTATLLANGKVLLAGGAHEDCGRFANAELYDPTTETFTATGTMTQARDNHTATLLPDGRVLIAGGESHDCDARGGCTFSGTTTSAEVYNPATGTFGAVGDMTARRAGHTASLLKNGTVLIAGGYCYEGIAAFCPKFSSAELYAAADLAAPVPVFRTPNSVSLSRHQAPVLPHASSWSAAVEPMTHSVASRAPDLLDRPSNVVATASGSGVVLTWIEPQERTPVRYAITGGASPGASTLPVIVTPDTSTHYTIQALPPGTYYFTVYAIFADALSAASNETAVTVSGAAAASGPASGAIARVDRGYVTASWTPVAGDALYEVEIGSEPGHADVAVVTTTQPHITYRANSGGNYLRVRSVRGGMVSAPSNEVFVASSPADCGAVPSPPLLLPVSTANGETTISWLPSAGPPAARYRVEGAGPVGPLTTTTRDTSTSLTMALEAAQYVIRVIGINGCGESSASNPTIFRVPR